MPKVPRPKVDHYGGTVKVRFTGKKESFCQNFEWVEDVEDTEESGIPTKMGYCHLLQCFSNPWHCAGCEFMNQTSLLGSEKVG